MATRYRVARDRGQMCHEPFSRALPPRPSPVSLQQPYRDFLSPRQQTVPANALYAILGFQASRSPCLSTPREDSDPQTASFMSW